MKRTALLALVAGGVLALAAVTPSSAATLFATGQNNGDPSHATGLFYYSIDSDTGKATPLAPITGGNFAGLGDLPDGRVIGFRSNRVVQIDPYTGATADLGPAIGGFSTTSLDALSDGRTYGTPVSGDKRLHRIDAAAGTATPVGPYNAIGNALDAFYGRPAGTTDPFIIGLGSLARRVNLGTAAAPDVVVSETLYGVHLDDANQLVAINPDTGFASVVGALDSVDAAGGDAADYGGFAAMTGADTDGDGLRDALFGNVNFNDADATLPNGRLGGVARYNPADGTFEVVGTNPGLIFFGFAAPVPEPSALAILGLGGLTLLRRRR